MENASAATRLGSTDIPRVEPKGVQTDVITYNRQGGARSSGGRCRRQKRKEELEIVGVCLKDP